MAGDSPKLWTKHFFIICLANLLTFISFHMLVATFPFFVKHLGGDDALAGLVAGIFSISALALRPFVGWILDHKSRRLPLLIGIAAMAALTFSYSVIRWLPLIVALRVLHGTAWAAAGTGNNTNACDHIPQPRFAEGMGYFGVTTTVSMATAPVLGLYLKDSFGFSTLFYVSALISCAAMAIALFVDYLPLPDKERVLLTYSVKSLLEKSALPASIVAFFFIIPYGAINTFIALYAAESGRGSGGMYFTIVALICGLMRITCGRLADHYGERPIVYAGNVCVILSMLALLLFDSRAAFYGSALVFGCGFGVLPPSLQAMAMRMALPQHRGAASSTYLCAFDLGIGLGGIISGVLVKYLGHVNMFACMMLPGLCSLLVYRLWAGNSTTAFRKTPAVLEKGGGNSF